MEIAIDTETTGSDFYHGCMPFYVSTCTDTDGGLVRSWEWDVDLFTRIPQVDDSEVVDILELLYSADRIWLQNTKFDVLALSTIGIIWDEELWAKTNDTLIQSHLIQSIGQHGLKALSTVHLMLSNDDEMALADAATVARRKATSYNNKHDPKINIACANHPMFPGTKSPHRKGKDDDAGWWCLDMWLPRAMQIYFGEMSGGTKEWLTICSKYADNDAIRTLSLSQRFEPALIERGQMDLYRQRMDLVRITYEMEKFGVPVRRKYMGIKAKAVSALRSKLWREIDGDKVNPNSPKQLSKKLFEDLGLPILQVTKGKRKKDGTTSKGGSPSTKEEVLKDLLLVADDNAQIYLTNLMKYKKTTSMVTYLTAYELNLCNAGRLRSRYNVTGTQTTRFSASLLQNVGKREDMNLRDVFGPEDGHYWISADYVNIELIIAATIANEEELLDVFRRGESWHILIASAIYPDELAALGESDFKKCNLYRRVKSGNYAIQYGAMEAKADWTYGKKGAYQAIRSRLRRLFSLSDAKLEEARDCGYVKTLSGYPLVCPTQRGKVEPTKPFSYWCQGSVGDVISQAMVHVDLLPQMLDVANRNNMQMIMNVHDELVFDINESNINNWPKYGAIVKDQMESAALRFGVQVPVNVSLHKTSWRTEDASIKGVFR